MSRKRQDRWKQVLSIFLPLLVQTSLRDGSDQELYALWVALAQQLP